MRQQVIGLYLESRELHFRVTVHESSRRCIRSSPGHTDVAVIFTVTLGCDQCPVASGGACRAIQGQRLSRSWISHPIAAGIMRDVLTAQPGRRGISAVSGKTGSSTSNRRLASEPPPVCITDHRGQHLSDVPRPGPDASRSPAGAPQLACHDAPGRGRVPHRSAAHRGRTRLVVLIVVVAGAEHRRRGWPCGPVPASHGGGAAGGWTRLAPASRPHPWWCGPLRRSQRLGHPSGWSDLALSAQLTGLVCSGRLPAHPARRSRRRERPCTR